MSNKYNTVDLVCPICNKEYKKRVGDYNRNLRKGRESFCSVECSSKNRKLELSEQEISLIKDNYLLPVKEISELLQNKISDTQIHHQIRQLKKHNLIPRDKKSPRHLFHNETYFSNLQKEQAYYGGLLAADGCISEQENLPYMSIALKDREIVELFKDDIKYTGNVDVQKSKNKKHADKYRLRISCCYQIAKDLKKHFNIVPRKTHILTPPNITDEDLIWAFIKGYIDGDGSIMWLSQDGIPNKRFRISIAGTKEMLEWMREFFMKNVPDFTYNKIRVHSCNNITNEYIIEGSKAKRLAKIIKNSIPTHGIERKWEKV